VFLHHRVFPLVEKEPRSVQNSVRMQNSSALSQIKHRVLLREMREHGERIHQGKLPIFYRERCRQWLAGQRVESHMVNVVVKEREIRSNRLKVSLTPTNHSRMEIDADVHLWTGVL
jgi:hypothetical protein